MEGSFFEDRQAAGSVFEGKSELAARPHDLYCTITNGVIPWRMGRLENSPYPMRLAFDAIFKYKKSRRAVCWGWSLQIRNAMLSLPFHGLLIPQFCNCNLYKETPRYPSRRFSFFPHGQTYFLVVPFVHGSFYFSRKKKKNSKVVWASTPIG